MAAPDAGTGRILVTDAPKLSPLERLREAGADPGALDEPTRRAAASVCRALLGSGNATCVDRVDLPQWPRLPLLVDLTLRGTLTVTEQYWLVVPWTRAVFPSAGGYLRLAREPFERLKPTRALLVTSEPVSEGELDEAARESGLTVVLVRADTLEAAGPRRSLRGLAVVTGRDGFAARPEFDVGRALVEHNAELEKADAFRDRLFGTMSRAWITPALIAVNVAVFLAMVACGVDFWMPTVDDVLAWGGCYGPNVAAGEGRRLLTANYVHVGLLHLAFNMWCLWAAGQLLERLLGRFTFVLVYTLSGLGGSILSVAVDPVRVSAGASGAVFGIVGGVVGFLVVRRRNVPALISKPLLSSALLFIGFNLYFGFTSSMIDNAAHVGGLATGLLCGVLLSRGSPAVGERASLSRVARVVGVVVLLVAGAAMAVARVPEGAKVWAGRPKPLGQAHAEFAALADPLVAEAERDAEDVEALLWTEPADELGAQRRRKYAADLLDRARLARRRLGSHAAGHPDLDRLRRAILEVLLHREKACAALVAALETGGPEHRLAGRRHLVDMAGALRRAFIERQLFLQSHPSVPAGD